MSEHAQALMISTKVNIFSQQDLLTKEPHSLQFVRYMLCLAIHSCSPDLHGSLKFASFRRHTPATPQATITPARTPYPKVSLHGLH